MKLNKNQRRFFEEAVKHFKEKSVDVRLKDIGIFAEKEGLIVPTSALKNYCQEDGQIRGHYNLTLTGIEYTEPEPEYDHTPDIVKKFNIETDVIEDTSAFVDAPKKKKKAEKFSIKGLKPLHVIDPVYVVCDTENCIISINRSPEGAFQSGLRNVLHDHGNRSESDVVTELRYKKVAVVDSINSWLYFNIQVIEVRK